MYIRDCGFGLLLFFFFKQKTAYEMRISDWSSDVCSSDLIEWARTDRNGLVSLRLDSEDPRFEIARGELSDAGVDKIKPASSKAPAKRPRHRRVPPTPQPSPGASRLAGLPRLTFVTHEARLKARIGGAADQSFDLIRASGPQLVDLVTDMTPFEIGRAH